MKGRRRGERVLRVYLGSALQTSTTGHTVRLRSFHQSTVASRWGWLSGGDKSEQESKDEKGYEEEQEETYEEEDVEEYTEDELSEASYAPDDTWNPTLELPVESLLHSNESAEVIELNPNIFLAPIREDLMHRVISWQRAAIRQGTAKTKRRSEVRGGGKKPWQQKGTGRARHGSIRSPLWRGGGVAHPKRPRNYYYPLNAKVRVMGLCSALSVKYAQGNIKVVEDLNLDSAKTRDLYAQFEEKGWDKVRNLMVYDYKREYNTNFDRAHKNIRCMKAFNFHLLFNNVFDVLKTDQVILTKGCLEKLDAYMAPKVTPIFTNYTLKATENSLAEQKQSM